MTIIGTTTCDSRAVHAALAPLAIPLAAMQASIRRRIDTEQAALDLLCVTGPDRLDAALQEASRREEVFRKAAEASPRTPVEDPQLAALRSVTADVMAGRLV